MDLPDVNVLVCAYRDDTPDHGRCRLWLDATVNGPAAFAISDLVLSSFIRVVTHPRIFKIPSPVGDAMAFASGIRDLDHCVPVFPGPRHWTIFTALCRESEARGNLVPDAFLAALAIESGAEWVTIDGDFSRFPGLRWRRPQLAAH
ncbi:MAG: type II toxin-antitoxin system VapC family toxin [Bryobacterales bacterium]|nr:type II toxin-antitoxin system VapC family toxin [Bryobacterales bacterium]